MPVSFADWHYDEHFAVLNIRSEYEYDTSGIWTIINATPMLSFEHEFGSMHRQVELTKRGKLTIITKLVIPEQTISQNQKRHDIDYYTNLDK